VFAYVPSATLLMFLQWLELFQYFIFLLIIVFLTHMPAITQIQSTIFINNDFRPSFLCRERLCCIQGIPLNCTVLSMVKNCMFVKGL